MQIPFEEHPITDKEKSDLVRNWGRRIESNNDSPAIPKSEILGFVQKANSAPEVEVLNSKDNTNSVKAAIDVYSNILIKYNALVTDRQKKASINSDTTHRTLGEAIAFLEKLKKEIDEMKSYIAQYEAKAKKEQAKFNLLLSEIVGIEKK